MKINNEFLNRIKYDVSDDCVLKYKLESKNIQVYDLNKDQIRKLNSIYDEEISKKIKKLYKLAKEA